MRHQYATPWIWIFLIPLAFDYKATDATTGHFAQFGLVLPSMAAGLALLLIAPRFHERARLRTVVTISITLCVFGSLVAQLVQDNDTGNYLRTLLPFVLFLLGYLVACRPWSEYRISQFEKALFVANLISAGFTFVYGMATGGDLEDVRFRIISVTLLGLQGVLLHEFVVARRFSLFTVAVFASTIVMELLSVTRSMLVGTVLLFLLAVFMSAPSIQHLGRAFTRSLLVGVLLAGMAGVAALAFPAVAEHWTQRIFASEVTTIAIHPSICRILPVSSARKIFTQSTNGPRVTTSGCISSSRADCYSASGCRLPHWPPWGSACSPIDTGAPSCPTRRCCRYSDARSCCSPRCRPHRLAAIRSGRVFPD
jgi:hypothetical protein